MSASDQDSSLGKVSEETKLFTDMWLRQSDLFLKLAALVPVLEITILAGWYALIKDDQPVLAIGIAWLGAIVMALALLILWRAGRRVLHFRLKIGELLTGLPRAVVTGRWTAVALPAVGLAVNLSLAFELIKAKPFPAKPPPTMCTPAAPAK
jgi:divalent metal cation (Fe/Co/Zn/Cd) transporter